MKFRSTLLLGATFLLAAMPAFGDNVTYPGSIEEFRNVASAEKAIDIQRPDSNASVGADFSPRAALGMLPSRNFDISTSKSFLRLDTSFTTAPDTDTRTAGLSIFDLYDRASWFARDEEESRKAKHDHDGGKGGSHNPSPVSMPEPGSLALSLVGLIGIGFLARHGGVLRDA
ncbi:MAG: hypothetical protein WBV36_11105 [Terriglobales bacterium]